MGVDWVLAAKAGVGVGLTAVGLLVWRTSWIEGLTPPAATRWFVGTLLVTRLGVFLALFLVAGVSASSDVAGHYYPQALAVLAGQVPYRDFRTSYGLAFPYLAALPVWLWDAPESLILFAIALELLAAPLWLAVGRRLGGEAVARRAALLYAVSPLPLLNVAVSGQNQVWVAAGLALATSALLERRDVLSGLVLGLAGAGVKILALLFAPALALAARRPPAWVAGCLVAPLAVVGLGWLGPLDVLMPFRAEARLYSSGNIPFVLGIAGVDLDAAVVRGVLWVALAAVLGGMVVLIRHHRGGGSLWIAHALTLLLLGFLLTSRKSYTSYLVTGFVPLCLSVAARGVSGRTIALFGALGTAAVVEPSARFRWLGRRGLWQLGEGATPSGRAGLAGLLLLECAVLGGYVWLVVRSWRALRGDGRQAPRAARAHAW
jgi:hypothetical protein